MMLLPLLVYSVSSGETMLAKVSTFQFLCRFFRKYLHFSYELKKFSRMFSNASILKWCEAGTDISLAGCLQHRVAKLRTPLGRSTGNPIQGRNASPAMDDEIRIKKTDKFSDLLAKCAVIHLTCFLKMITENFYVRDKKELETFSHYAALYWYKQKQYAIVLKLCDRILQEVTKEDENDWPMHPCLTFMPTFIHPFQDLFDSDVNCLMGLLFIIDKDLLLCIQSDNSEVRRTDICVHIRTRFLARYLRVRCLIQRGDSGGEIVSAIRELSRQLSSEHDLFLEHLLYRVLVVKVNRIRQKKSSYTCDKFITISGMSFDLL